MFSAWRNAGLSINPCVNLVSNIGFGDFATHAMEQNHPLASLPVQEDWISASGISDVNPRPRGRSA